MGSKDISPRDIPSQAQGLWLRKLNRKGPHTPEGTESRAATACASRGWTEVAFDGAHAITPRGRDALLVVDLPPETKPTTPPKKRLAGYYWVRLKGNTMAQAWRPAYYRAAADQWNLFGGAVANPEALLEVGPPMLSPDERPVTRGQRNPKVQKAEGVPAATKPRTRGRPRKTNGQAADTQEG